MTIEQLYQHIKERKYRYARIERNNIPLSTFTDNTTPEVLVAELKKFQKYMDSGSYKFYLRKSDQATKDSENCLDIYLDTDVALQGNKPANQSAQDIEAIAQSIEKRIRVEYEAKEKERLRQVEIQDLKDELAELKSPMNRLAATGVQLLNMYADKNPTVKNVLLRGVPPSPDTDTQTQAPMPKDLTEAENDKLDQAENILLKYLTVDEILTFANKVEADPNIIAQMKTFNVI